MTRNRCTKRPRFDVMYNDAVCPDCVMDGDIGIHQNTNEHLDGFVHCKKGSDAK